MDGTTPSNFNPEDVDPAKMQWYDGSSGGGRSTGRRTRERSAGSRPNPEAHTQLLRVLHAVEPDPHYMSTCGGRRSFPSGLLLFCVPAGWRRP